MANILSLAMKINADASGFKLDPVQRALVGLGTEADKLTSQFDKFKGSSEAAARAQDEVARKTQDLINALRDGGSATQFAADFERLTQAAREQVAAFERGAEVTRQYLSVEERRAEKIAELDRLVQAGAISEQTYAAAVADVSGANAAAAETERQRLEALAESERQRQAIIADGARFAAQYATEDEKRAASLQRISDLLEAGAISEDIAARARAEASGANAAAAEAERQRSEALAQADRDRQATLAEGQRLAQQFATVEEKRAAELERISRLLDQGAISEETAARARAEATGANEAAAKAEKERADALAAASRIIQANLTPQERYDSQIQELQGHLDAGRLSQEQFNRAAAKAQQDLDRVAASATKTDSNIESLTKNVRLLSAIEVGRLIVDGIQAISNVITNVVGNIASFVSRIASSFDQFNDLSARTGIGVEALQGYSLAAKLAGVDTAEFGAAVQRLSVTIGKATPGDNLDKSLRAINLSVAQLRGLAPEQQFSAISDAISGLPTAADRAAAAVEIFGKQGAALAPLFREGAASIEELRERAERLGIIVDETQLDNIGSMNDAFDLARATVEGIAGQVIGNLAPAVTAVVDEFLKFIESWEGAEGTGGTGIANAITDVLLTGAETLAGVFDKFVGDFSGFTSVLQGVGETFSFVANILTAAAETLRIIFNVFESIGNGIALALGKVLEGIGSWVSSDLEAFGKSLQEESRRALEQNNKDLESAATNAATAVQRAFTGDAASPVAAGEGAASQFVQGVRQRFEREQAPEFRINTNIEETRDRFDSFFGGIIDQSSAVVEPMREFEAAVAAAQADGELTADEIARIEELQAKVNASLDQELASRQEIADAAAKQSEEVDKIIEASLEQMRIDNEFGGDSSRAKAAENVLKLEQEAIRVEEQLRLARDAGDQEAIDAATRRLAQIDQVAARESDIASGRAKADKEQESRLKKLNEDIAKRNDDLLAKQFEIELERARELATVRAGSIEINDIREGGISAFFDTLKEDPAIGEAKKQTKELETIRKELAKLQAEKVDILGGTG